MTSSILIKKPLTSINTSSDSLNSKFILISNKGSIVSLPKESLKQAPATNIVITQPISSSNQAASCHFKTQENIKTILIQNLTLVRV